MSYLSVVIPVLDERESLPRFHAELLTALGGLGVAAEVVYVDDGSSDGSTELLESFTRAPGGVDVRVVVLRRRFGKSGALAAGFAAARGRVVATMDADGQDVPAELGRLLRAMDSEGLDLVGGWRRRRHDRLVKRAASRWYNAATRVLTGLPIRDGNTGLKVLRAEVARELPLYGDFHRFLPVLAHDLGFRVGEVAVAHRPRAAGRTKYRSVVRFPRTLLDLATVLFLTRFADRPLYLLGGVGAALSGVGLAILLYLSVLRLFFAQGIGQRPLLMLGALALLVGVQLIATGLIGDTLRHQGWMDRPSYRVRRVVEAEAAEPPARRVPSG
jgi:glycosyltransferase involved in cell wall biosynthesis